MDQCGTWGECRANLWPAKIITHPTLSIIREGLTTILTDYVLPVTKVSHLSLDVASPRHVSFLLALRQCT